MQGFDLRRTPCIEDDDDKKSECSDYISYSAIGPEVNYIIVEQDDDTNNTNNTNNTTNTNNNATNLADINVDGSDSDSDFDVDGYIKIKTNTSKYPHLCIKLTDENNQTSSLTPRELMSPTSPSSPCFTPRSCINVVDIDPIGSEVNALFPEGFTNINPANLTPEQLSYLMPFKGKLPQQIFKVGDVKFFIGLTGTEEHEKLLRVFRINGILSFSETEVKLPNEVISCIPLLSADVIDYNDAFESNVKIFSELGNQTSYHEKHVLICGSPSHIYMSCLYYMVKTEKQDFVNARQVIRTVFNNFNVVIDSTLDEQVKKLLA